MKLIARERELADVAQRFANGSRLVTIVGPGGIGKTALARTALGELFPSIPANLVELDRVERSDAVRGALAAQLGFATFDILLASPAELPAVLLIDNCEHVIDGAAEALASLCEASPGVAVLATSRSPLDIPGESVLALSPLPVPLPGAADADSGAVQLFLERARDAGVDIADADLTTVGRLCRCLDGMPLAIELAASRSRVIDLYDIIHRLGEGVDVLARQTYRGVQRHRSVHETIEWSVRLLDEDDRYAFAWLGVCAGPFPCDLAAAVIGTLPSNAMSIVERLVDSSLLVVDRRGRSMQYRMLEPIRAVARDQLALRGNVDEALERLTAYVVGITSSMISQTAVRWDADLLPTVAGRFEQIDAAIRYTVTHDSDPTRAFTLYTILGGMFNQPRIDEIMELGELIIGRWPDTSVAQGADAAGTFAMAKQLCGEGSAAKAIATRALPHAAASAFASVLLRRVLAYAARSDGDHAAAAEFFGEAETAARAQGIPTMELGAKVYRAQDLAALGHTGEALELVRHAVVESRRLDSIVNELWAQVVEAAILRTWRPPAAEGGPTGQSALALASETLEVSRRIDYPFGVVCSLQTIVACHLDDENLPDAAGAATALLDAVARCGPGELRRALDLASAVLAADAHVDAADLAASARALPDTSPMAMPVAIAPALAETGRRLDRASALLTARLGLADVQARRGESSAHLNTHPEASSEAAVFLQSGDTWQIEFEGLIVHVRTSKGMHDLARLLAQPGREFHCAELIGALVDETSTGEVIDDTTRRQLEARIRELQDEIDEAERHNDFGQSDRAQAELDTLIDYLTSALGLGGRARRQGGTVERARSAVTHRIRGAVRRIEAAHHQLGRHLGASITTGIYCRYDPETAPNWRTGSTPDSPPASRVSASV